MSTTHWVTLARIRDEWRRRWHSLRQCGCGRDEKWYRFSFSVLSFLCATLLLGHYSSANIPSRTFVIEVVFACCVSFLATDSQEFFDSLVFIQFLNNLRSYRVPSSSDLLLLFYSNIIYLQSLKIRNKRIPACFLLFFLIIHFASPPLSLTLNALIFFDHFVGEMMQILIPQIYD